jgi:hypothetical protein
MYAAHHAAFILLSISVVTIQILVNVSSCSNVDFYFNSDINQASRQWDKFYNRNEIKFFKDRHYLMREFDEFSENCGSAEAHIFFRLIFDDKLHRNSIEFVHRTPPFVSVRISMQT